MDRYYENKSFQRTNPILELFDSNRDLIEPIGQEDLLFDLIQHGLIEYVDESPIEKIVARQDAVGELTRSILS